MGGLVEARLRGTLTSSLSSTRPRRSGSLRTRSGAPSASTSAWTHPLGVDSDLGQLHEWWLDGRCPVQSREGERNRLSPRVFKTPLASLSLPQVPAAAVDAHRVHRIMRHRDVRTTLGIYGRLDVEDLRAAVARLPGGASDVPATPLRRAAGTLETGPLVTRLLTAASEAMPSVATAEPGQEKTPGNHVVTGGKMERENGFEV